MWTPITRRQHSRGHLRYGSDLTDAERAIIAPLPPEAGKTGRPRRWGSALQAQTDTAIEMLITDRMHVCDLTKLDVERNLVRPGRAKTMRIVIAAEERNNRQPLDPELPEKSVVLIEHYLQKFRPRLAPPPLSNSGRWVDHRQA
jgi:hypothetical protein